jgi:hypothetical protein
MKIQLDMGTTSNDRIIEGEQIYFSKLIEGSLPPIFDTIQRTSNTLEQPKHSWQNVDVTITLQFSRKVSVTVDNIEWYPEQDMVRLLLSSCKLPLKEFYDHGWILDPTEEEYNNSVLADHKQKLPDVEI